MFTSPQHLQDYQTYELIYDLGIIDNFKRKNDDENYTLGKKGKDGKDLYLTPHEYSFCVQGFNNLSHMIHRGRVLIDKSNTGASQDYITIKENIHLPSNWFRLIDMSQDTYTFENVGNHFFKKCSNMLEVNTIVNMAEDLGYTVENFEFSSLNLEMKKNGPKKVF